MVSGLDSRTHLTRVILRFGSSDDAHRASENLTKEGRATEKTLLSSDEIEAYTKLVIPKMGVYLRLFIIVLVLVALFPNFTDVFALVFWSLFIVIIVLPMTIFQRAANKHTTLKTWLRMEGSSLYLRTADSFALIVPRRLEWKDPSHFVLYQRRRGIELGFTMSEEATRAFELIVRNFPGVQVSYAEKTADERGLIRQG